MAKLKYLDLRQAVIDTCLRMNEEGINQGTSGNVSVRTPEGFLITASGIPYGRMKPEHVVEMDLDGGYIGEYLPSTEWRMHLDIFKHRPEAGAIVHTHSTYATAWAQSLRDIPIFGTTHADHNTVDIPCASPMDDAMIAGNYEYETGFQIMNCFKEKGLSYEEVEMMIVGNHAPFTWGKDGNKAVYNAAVLEQVAKMAWLTEQINPHAPRLKEALIKKHYERKHGPDSYYGQ